MTPHFDALHGFEDPDGADHETTRRRSARILADHELQRDADLRGFPRITNSTRRGSSRIPAHHELHETRIFPDNVHTDRAAWESRSAARSAPRRRFRPGSDRLLSASIRAHPRLVSIVHRLNGSGARTFSANLCYIFPAPHTVTRRSPTADHRRPNGIRSATRLRPIPCAASDRSGRAWARLSHV
jgi:hypothetical protein